MTQTIEKNIANPDKAQVWLDRDNPHRTTTGSLPTIQDAIKNQFYKNQNLLNEFTRQNRYKAERSDFLFKIASSHQEQGFDTAKKNIATLDKHVDDVKDSLSKVNSPYTLWQQWLSYSTDSTKRILQTADVLKKRGDVFVEHERAGCPPVLIYDYDVVMDASTFERPSNYVLLRIKPPAGIETDDTNRPYIIIDPRAGHGAGIGGFKPESQVGVALKNGRPVYFVAFKRLPEPTQTIADVTYAEAKFVREVEKRHPEAGAPVVIGNCQGGWAALILAATNPDITGPIVMNGAPVAAWSGNIGVDPMRYKAGVNGGTWQAMLSADMTNGVFDGAWLVNNFEQMNTYRNYIGKYYDLYQNPIANSERFLNFERWWGGFFLMNESEIRWIVENIFIGNRLARNTAQLEAGVNIDLRNVKAPVIVFASHGDDITPPPQALAWIMDAYTDEKEIEVCGQRIIYMIHDQVGHLGIFVSSSIAKREHKSIASIMDTIELLPPGLYEMEIENVEGEGEDKTFSVDLTRRTFDDLNQAIGECRTDEKVFRAVHRSSKAQTSLYEQTLRPIVKSMSNETTAQILRSMHPLRLQRGLWTSENPLALATSTFSKVVTNLVDNSIDNSVNNSVNNSGINADSMATPKDMNTNTAHEQTNTAHDENRTLSFQDYGKVKLPTIEPINQDNLFLQVEKTVMDSLSMTMDFWSDLQGLLTETTFFGVWSMPWMRNYGNVEGSRRLTDKDALRSLPKVEATLAKIEDGGYIEAVIRMLILANIVADNNIMRNQLSRLTEVLATKEPFNSLSSHEVADIIQEQTLIVRFAEDDALSSLKILLENKPKRIEAYKQVQYVVGTKRDALNPKTVSMLERIKDVLDLKESDVSDLNNKSSNTKSKTTEITI